MGGAAEFSLANTIKVFFQRKFDHWLARRIPNRAHHQLNSRNIMIYPTRFGLAYLCFVTLIFLLGTNYQNNIILLLSYLLASLFITVMLHSFFNFSQLRFHSVAKQQGYAGGMLYFPITITADKNHYDLSLHFTDTQLTAKSVHVEQYHQGSHVIQLPYAASTRGKHYLGRVTIFSEYSLGIFKSKAILDFGHYAVIFPKPKRLITGQFKLSSQNNEPSVDSYQTTEHVGSDDFSELKSFVQGESRARTAWKQLAKGQGHFSKHYQASQGQLQWLNISDMPSNDIEIQLAYLSFLIAELSASNQQFGLQLYADSVNQSKNIAPNSGANHQQACLTALALY